MKKRERKLQLHRETVRQLDGRELTAAELAKAQGGTGRYTSCIEPNCCGDQPVDTV